MKRIRKDKDCIRLQSLIKANKRAERAERLANSFRKMYREATIKELKAERKEQIGCLFSGYEADCIEHLSFALLGAINKSTEEIQNIMKEHAIFRNALYKKFDDKRKELQIIEVDIDGKVERYKID